MLKRTGSRSVAYPTHKPHYIDHSNNFILHFRTLRRHELKYAQRTRTYGRYTSPPHPTILSMCQCVSNTLSVGPRKTLASMSSSIELCVCVFGQSFAMSACGGQDQKCLLRRRRRRIVRQTIIGTEPGQNR